MQASSLETTRRWRFQPKTPAQQLLFALGLMATAAALFFVLSPHVGQMTAAGVLTPTIPVVLLLAGGSNLEAMGLHRRRLLRELALGLGGLTVITIALTGIIAAVFGVIAARDTLASIAAYPIQDRIALLAIGLIAALTEEPLFRGYIQPAAMKTFGATGGIIATVTLFVLIHPVIYAGSIAPLLGKIAVGITLGLMRGRDRSLMGPMIAHALVWVLWGHA